MAEVNEVKVSTNRIGEILFMPTENSTQTAKPAVQNVGSAALTAKDLSFAYDEEKVILSHAETQVHTGEIVALTGENGSGKSTLTKLLIGFYTPIRPRAARSSSKSAIKPCAARKFAII